MRISDWISDVCSSDLADLEESDPRDQPRAQQLAGAGRLARALRRGAAAPRPARAPADRAGDHRGARAPSGGFPPRLRAPRQEIGRASCRDRVCQYDEISVVAVSLKKKIQDHKK